MAIDIPRTWSVGRRLTSGDMNRFVSGIQRSLAGSAEPIELQNGVRPGAYTAAQLAALTNVPAGTLFYDETTQRIVYHDGTDVQPTGFSAHDSGLFSLIDVVSGVGQFLMYNQVLTHTISHTLGRPPVFFQLVWERTNEWFGQGDNPGTRNYGWTVGQHWYLLNLGHHRVSLQSSTTIREREAILDVSATDYTINFPSVRLIMPRLDQASIPAFTL